MSEGVNYGAENDPTLHPLQNLIDSLGSTHEDSAEAAAAPASGAEQLTGAAAVKARCIQEVGQGLADIRKRLDSGLPLDEAASKFSGAVLDLAQSAAEAGDHDTFALHLDTLLKLPGLSPTTLAYACFAGLRLNDQRSFHTLHSALEAEKLREKDRRGKPISTLLDRVVDYCADNDEPPDSWMEDYGIDAKHRFTLRSAYYLKLIRKADEENRPHYQAQLDSHMDRLLEKKAFPASFVFEQVWYALVLVRDPEIRTRLLDGFMKSGDTVFLNAYTFDALNWVGIAVLDDPGLANQRTVGYFDRTIEACGQKLLEKGMPLFDVVSKQLFWRTKLALYHGASPQDVIDLIDLQTSSLLAADIPDRQGGLGQNLMRNREYVERTRDNLLSACAQHFAEQENFGAANLLLSHIMRENELTSALDGCLDKVKSTDDVATVRLDDLTMELNPGLDRHFTLAEAKLAGDTSVLEGITLAYAHTVLEGNYAHNYKRLQMAYEALAERDSLRAISTAKQLLAILRQANVPTYEITYLSESLINAGDQDEPLLAKEYIDRIAKDNFERLQDTWELSKVL